MHYNLLIIILIKKKKGELNLQAGRPKKSILFAPLFFNKLVVLVSENLESEGEGGASLIKLTTWEEKKETSPTHTNHN